MPKFQDLDRNINRLYVLSSAFFTGLKVMVRHLDPSSDVVDKTLPC